MFTILKGLDFSRTFIQKESLSFFVSLMFFGVNVRLFISKSYWVNL